MYKFGDIDVVLLDFQPHVRRVMKFALNELGITGARARECGDVDAVRSAVKESDPDILILDEPTVGVDAQSRQMIMEKLQEIKQNGTIEIYEWEGHGKIRQARPAAIFEQNPGSVDLPAPHLGEHTESILHEAGLDNDLIQAAMKTASN